MGVAIFTVGSAVCAVSGTLGMLVAGRSCRAPARRSCSSRSPCWPTGWPTTGGDGRRILWSAVNGLGVALGPLIGGAVTESFGSPGVFWILVPVGPSRPDRPPAPAESAGPDRDIDLLGVFCSPSATVMALISGIVQAGRGRLGSATALSGSSGHTAAVALCLAGNGGWPNPLSSTSTAPGPSY